MLGSGLISTVIGYSQSHLLDSNHVLRAIWKGGSPLRLFPDRGLKEVSDMGIHQSSVNLQSNRSKKTTPSFRRFGRWIASSLLSMTKYKTRRAVMLASAYAYILGKDEFDQATLERLNETLKLANNTDSLGFPVKVSKWVWQDAGQNIPISRGAIVNVLDIPDIQLTEKDIREISEDLVRRSPTWLRYGQGDRMSSEFFSVLSMVVRDTRPPIALINIKEPNVI